MKISFRQGLAVAVSSLLLFSSAGAWAVCDTELAAHASDPSYSTQFQNYLKKQHEYLLTVSERGVWSDQYFGQSDHKGDPNNYSAAERLAYVNDRLKTAQLVGERNWHMYALCMINSKSANNARTAQQQVQVQQQSQQAQQAAQQQSTQAQQAAQQSQALATQNQARADQSRQGKRRRHEPENEASQCIQPDFGGLYGGMKNTCNFKVWYTYCGYRPKENSWLAGMNCEKQKFGSDSVGPGRTSAAHTHNVEMLYWIACKEPAWTVDTEFVPGQGIQGRCHTVGGN